MLTWGRLCNSLLGSLYFKVPKMIKQIMTNKELHRSASELQGSDESMPHQGPDIHSQVYCTPLDAFSIPEQYEARFFLGMVG